MPSNIVADVISDLQKFYAKKLTDTQLDFYTSQLTAMHEDDLCRGAILLKRKERTFPVIPTIWQYVNEAREVRLDSEKKQAPIFADLEKNNQVTENGKRAIAMMRDLYEGQITRVQYLTRMFEMEKDFPGIGWKKEAEELKQFWATEPERHARGKRILERLRAEAIMKHRGRDPERQSDV